MTFFTLVVILFIVNVKFHFLKAFFRFVIENLEFNILSLSYLKELCESDIVIRRYDKAICSLSNNDAKIDFLYGF